MAASESVSYNWMPASYWEFCSMVAARRIRLNIMDSHFGWLYANVLPCHFFHSSSRYQTELLRKMASDEATFQKVHDHGIDLILLGVS